MEMSRTTCLSEEEPAATPDPALSRADSGEENSGDEAKYEDGKGEEGEEENESASDDKPVDEQMELAEISEIDDSVDSTIINASGEPTTSLEESNLETVTYKEEKHHEAIENTVVKTLVFSNEWAKTFKSPVGSDGFSPSQAGSNHGLGLQLAVERNISTTLFLDNISTFLSNLASIYEQLGMNLVKLSCFISPQQLPFKTSIDDDFRSLYEVILSLSDGFRNSADCYRSTIITSMQKLLTTNGTERDMAVKRYREARQECVDARKAALSNYSKTKNTANAVEKEILTWFSILQKQQKSANMEETKETEGTVEFLETDLPWEKSLKLIGRNEDEMESTSLLIKKLKLVQACEEQYIGSVEKENKCVASSQEKEEMALTKAQKMEEDQMNFFVNVVLAKVFPRNESKGDLSTTRPSFAVSGEERTFGTEKKGIELLSSLNLFKAQNTPYEEGMGRMDAETLGLPEDLGVQRDNIKSSFSSRENLIKVTGIVLKLFEEIANVTAKSSFKLRSQITSQRRKDASGGTPSDTFPSSQAGSLWRTTMSIFDDEAKLLAEIAFKASKLEKWFSASKRILQNEIDADDAAWKQVCDAARTEMRLETRYKQTKQQMEKVRQRASSKELGISIRRLGSMDSTDDSSQSQSQRKRIDSSGSVSTGAQSTPNKVGRAFFKGGEAMKKLTENATNAMVQIAQIGMTEKDQKEAKDQLALEEAREVKNRVVRSYATSTKERIDKFNSEDNTGWTEMKSNIEKMTESVKALNTIRSTVFESRVSLELEKSFQSVIRNAEEWSKNVQEKILKSDQPSSPSTRAIFEYALTTKPTKSCNVDILLGLDGNDTTIPKLNLENEAIENESDEQCCDGLKNTTSDQPQNSGSDSHVEEQKEPEKVPNDVHPSDVEGNHRPPHAVEDSPEMRAFKKHFWSNEQEGEKMPDIIEIHICAYRPKERVAILSSNVYGRIYTTKGALYFLGTDKIFSLQWETITSIEKEKRFIGYNNDTDLVVSHQSKGEIASFVLCRLKNRDKVLAHLKKLKEECDNSEPPKVRESTTSPSGQSTVVPPDSLLKDMDVVLSKTIKNVSIKSVFENAWADQSGDKSFYGSWLEEEGCFDITMEEWKLVGEGNKLKNEWCKEEYDQHRLVTFKFNRSTHLYIGPPVAFVKQRHFIRVEGNDRFVLAISAEFEGIPYADTFAVEMRWVATRKGADDVQVQVGLFVNFKKKTMLKTQIKAGTVDETKNVHLRLFEAVKKASCLFFAGKYFIRSIFGSSGHSDTLRLENQIQNLQGEVRALHKSIDLLTGLLKEMKSECNQSSQ
eukprot:jgi/Psemu1/322342/estExt_fgenesh1_pg.C_260056